MYEIEKEGGYYCVKAASSGIVQFRSTKRINCVEWIKVNSPTEEEKEE